MTILYVALAFCLGRALGARSMARAFDQYLVKCGKVKHEYLKRAQDAERELLTTSIEYRERFMELKDRVDRMTGDGEEWKDGD